MGLFSSPADKYSQDRRPISDLDLKRLVSRVHADTLTQGEESLVEQALLQEKRDHRGELSLQDIYIILNGLRRKKVISINDQNTLLSQFEKFFGKV